MKTIKLPFRIAPGGRVATVSDEAEQVAQEIRTAVLTLFGERAMRPDYGTDIYAAVFEPADPTFTLQATETVRLATSKHVPRAEIVKVVPDINESQPEVLALNILFRLRSTLDETVHTAFVRASGTVEERTV